MIVVDTCVLVHLFVKSGRTEIVRKLREADPAWRLPTAWRWEFANVLWKKWREDGMTGDQATALLRSTLERMRRFEQEVPVGKAFEAAMAHKITVYDAAFLALALRIQVPLITEDSELLKKSPQVSLTPEKFLGLAA